MDQSSATLPKPQSERMPNGYRIKLCTLPIAQVVGEEFRDELVQQFKCSPTTLTKLVACLTQPYCNNSPPVALQAFETFQQLADWVNSGQGSFDMLVKLYKGIGAKQLNCIQHILRRLELVANVHVGGVGKPTGWEGSMHIADTVRMPVITGVFNDAATKTAGLIFPPNGGADLGDVNSGAVNALAPVAVSIMSPFGDLKQRNYCR